MNYRTMRQPVFKAANYKNYGRGNYTVDDLRHIAQVTNSYGNRPTNLNHLETEKLIDTGYAYNFTVEGDTLWASFDVPEGVYDNLKVRDKFSVEIMKAEPRYISAIAFTDNPVVKFSDDSEGFTFTIKDNTLTEDSMEEYSESLETTEEAPVETSEVEVTEEETVEEFSTDPVIVATEVADKVQEAVDEICQEVVEEVLADEKDQLEAQRVTELEQRIAELEMKLAEKEDENAVAEEAAMAAKVEAYSVSAVADGVPPALASLLAPYALQSDSDKFSNEAVTFSNIAQQVVDFFKGKVSYSAILPTKTVDELTITEDFSEDAIIQKVRNTCEKEGISVGTEEYRSRLAKAFARNKI